MERWIAAWVQDRLGPNRVGIPLTKIKLFGLGQPLADGLKFIFKEEYTPAHVDKALFILAPIIDSGRGAGDLRRDSVRQRVLPPIGVRWGMQTEPIQLVVAPGVDVGMIYVFALSSIAVYGVILGGWASNNKYSFLGGLRSSAQLIAYEIPLGLGILGVVLAGRLVAAGDHYQPAGEKRPVERLFAAAGLDGLFDRLVCRSGPAAVRPARGRAGADRRLSHRIRRHEAAAVPDRRVPAHGHGRVLDRDPVLRRLAFLGHDRASDERRSSWRSAILRIFVLLSKVMGVILFFMLVRWSWPRFRFDQLMDLAWKVMLPLGLVNLVAVAALVEYGTIAVGR